MKTQRPKSIGCSKSTSKGEFGSNTGLSQEIRKILNKQSKVTSKKTRGASLVVQWLRICLPMQGTRV